MREKKNYYRRIAAFSIDIGLIFIILLKGESYLLNSLKFSETFTYTLLALVTVGYFLVKDGIFNGRSIGKLIFGLKVIEIESKRSCTISKSIHRNGIVILALIVSLIGAYIFKFIFGDQLAGIFGAGLIFAALGAAYRGFNSESGQTYCDKYAGTLVITTK